jgi:large subunit ribosomal protein L4
MHQVVTAQLAARRAGTQSTKTRAEVRGGGAKPYRQKGTGKRPPGLEPVAAVQRRWCRARPEAAQVRPEDSQEDDLVALRSALSDRAGEGKIVVVDSWGWDKPSTKAAVKALAGLGIEGRALVVVGRDDAAAALSFRNLPAVQLIAPGELNAYDVLCNEWIVFTKDLLPTFAGSVKRAAGLEVDEDTELTEEIEADEQAVVADEAQEPEAFANLGPAESDTVESDTVESASSVHPYGAGSHVALRDDAQPEGFPIKGNASSMLYHLPGTAFYGRTNAEVWFATADDAEAAGFARPESQQGDDVPDAGDATADAVSVEPYGSGSYAALAGDVQPEGFAIKGNANSMLYHTPDSPFYDRTNAEVWFATEADAEAAGFSKPASQKDAD